MSKKLTIAPIPTKPAPEPTGFVRVGGKMVWRAQKHTYKPEMTEIFHNQTRNLMLKGKSILFQPPTKEL